MAHEKRNLSPEGKVELFETLKERFNANMARHKGVSGAEVQTRLEANNDVLWSLAEMERTGGEPDVIGHDKKTGQFTFCDCSAESPKGRRSLCFDQEAWDSRKEHKPAGGSATGVAADMGIELLTEDEYHELQKLGEFDLKTSSWLQTPSDVRYLGGALFGDRRFGRVFIYHNGAESYYAARGFRGKLVV
jgi:Protein of unknown function (DUF4256)